MLKKKKYRPKRRKQSRMEDVVDQKKKKRINREWNVRYTARTLFASIVDC